MNYKEAVDFINSAAVFGAKLGLKNIGVLLNLLDNPQKDLKIIHVAGTNGKGSVCSYIAGILMTAGYRTGLFTSPYLEKFTERIQVDFKNIPDDKLTEYVMILKAKINIMIDEGYNHPTFFELNTAIAFMYFKESGCDAVVLETGLGGRYDSTNIIRNPVVCVISTIGYDHMTILGNTLGKIAYEKAGIIKEKRPVVLYGDNTKEAMDVIKRVAKEIEAEIIIADFGNIRYKTTKNHGYSFDFEQYKNLEIKMMGKHQVKNACLALKTIEILNKNGFNISEKDIEKGLRSTVWPGRIEIVSKNPMIICDATHNPQGAEVLKTTLDEQFPDKEIVYVMGVMKDKDYEKMAEIILKDAKGVVTVTPNWHRALSAHILLKTVKKYCENAYVGDTIEEAMRIALEMAGCDGIVCTLGSMYYIADVKRYVREKMRGIQ